MLSIVEFRHIQNRRLDISIGSPYAPNLLSIISSLVRPRRPCSVRDVVVASEGYMFKLVIVLEGILLEQMLLFVPSLIGCCASHD